MNSKEFSTLCECLIALIDVGQIDKVKEILEKNVITEKKEKDESEIRPAIKCQ